MKNTLQPSKRVRLSLAILSLASATAIVTPNIAIGGELESADKCDCGNGPTWCKNISVNGVSVSCFKH